MYSFVAHVGVELAGHGSYIVIEIPYQIDNTNTELNKARLSDLTVAELLKPLIKEYAAQNGLDPDDLVVSMYYAHLADAGLPVAVCFDNGKDTITTGDGYVYAYYLPTMAPPLTPANFTAVLLPDYSGVRYTWSDSLNEQKYFILNEIGNIVKELGPDVTEWVEPVVCLGQTITRRIVAVNDSGSSPASEPVSLRLPYVSVDNPYGLVGKVLDLYTVLWTWQYKGTGRNYELYDADTDELVLSFESDTKSIYETGLEAGKTYRRKLRVVTPEYTSRFTNKYEVTIPQTVEGLKPPAPVNFTAAAVGPDSIEYYWNQEDPIMVDGFYLCDKDGNVLYTIDRGARYFKETGLPSDQTYYRCIRSYNEHSTSEPGPVKAIKLTSMEYKARITCPIDHIQHYTPKTRINAFKSGVGDGLDLLVKGVISKTSQPIIIDTMERFLSEGQEPPVSAMSTGLFKTQSNWWSDWWVGEWNDMYDVCAVSYTPFWVTYKIEHKVWETISCYTRRYFRHRFFTRGQYYYYEPGSYELILAGYPEAYAVIDLHGYLTDHVMANAELTAQISYQNCYGGVLEFDLEVRFNSTSDIIDDILQVDVEWTVQNESTTKIPFTIVTKLTDHFDVYLYTMSSNEGIFSLIAELTDTVRPLAVRVGEATYYGLTFRDIVNKYLEAGGQSFTAEEIFNPNLELVEIKLYVDVEDFDISWAGTGNSITVSFDDVINSQYTGSASVVSGTFTLHQPVRISAVYDELNKKNIFSIDRLMQLINQQHELCILAEFDDGNVYNISKEATYTVEDPSICKVENGKILGLRPGTTIVTASFDGHEVQIPVTVDPLNDFLVFK